MGYCLNIRKRRPRSKLLTSSTPAHASPSPTVSGTSPGCTGQEQAQKQTAGTSAPPQDVPARLVSIDENKEMGVLEHDPQPLAISDPSPHCAGQEQGKEGPIEACDQLQHMSSSPCAMDKNEMDIDIVQHASQALTISNLSLGCVGQKQCEEEVPGVSEELQHVLSDSTKGNEEIFITTIRTTDVALGLRRLPAGFYVVLRHNGLEWRTEIKPSSVNNDIVEWSGPIPISSDLLAIVHFEVYASFEFQPVLGDGEQLRRLATTVKQLLDYSGENAPFTFFPNDGDAVSSCSSILVTVRLQRHEKSEPSGSRVVGPHWSIPEPRGELQDATNLGHSALSRYRKHGEKRDLERSIEQYERAFNTCPRGDPCRAAAQSNLAVANLIFFQVEGMNLPLKDALRLHQDALASRPVGHPDRPLTLIQLASTQYARLQKRRNRVNEANSEVIERLLHEAIELSTTESHEKRAATAMLGLCARHRGGRAQTGGQPSTEQDSTAGLMDENLWNLSASLLERFERFGDPGDLQRAVVILEGLVKSTSVWDRGYCVALGTLGVALQYRFERFGQLSDLEDAIGMEKEAVCLTPDDHPHKPAYLNNLGNSFQTRFQRLGQLSDLEDAISRKREAIWLTPDGHPHKPAYLNSLGTSFETRFSRLGQLSDLEDAIPTLREAVHLTPDDHPHKAGYLSNLGNSFQARFQRLGQLSDLEDAISSKTDAVRLTPDDHPRKPMYLNNLGNSFEARFQRLAELGDLEDAIGMEKEAVCLTPDDHPHKPAYLSNLGNSFQTRFQRLGQLSDLEDAISRKREAVWLTPDGHPHKPAYLNSLGNSFETRFQRLGQLSDLEGAISTQKDAVCLTPDGHPHKPGHLNDLGSSSQTRFQRLGWLSDLEDAISMKRDAVWLTPDGHPQKPAYLNNLGNSFETRFQHLGQLSDLEDAISMKRDAVWLTPDGHPQKPAYLNNLGNSFETRFQHLGQLSDLEVAISTQREAIHLTPYGHPHKPAYLNNLGNSLETRFQRLGQLNDLEDAISTQREAVHLTPDGHPHKPAYLNNLGNSFRTRFRRLGQLSDLEDAILTQKNAVHLTPHGHPRKPAYLNNLAWSFTARFLHLRWHSDIEHAISLSSCAASIPIGPTSVRFSAAQHWIECARLVRHPSLLHAYFVAVSLLPKLAWIGLSLSHRYDELARNANVVREAAAAALDAGLPETAVEWLEQGRLIVWGDLFQLRTAYDELSSAHPEYASRLHVLSTQLDRASVVHEQLLSTLSEEDQSGAGHAPALQQAADRHRALAIERDQLLQEIRRLPGFENFLLRKSFAQLRAATHSGPVVVLNAARNRCDALIVVARLDQVIHVPLPNFTSERYVDGLQVILNGFVRGTRGGMLVQQGISWDHILSPLWKCVVKPVLDALAFSVRPEEPSRIFWCPTGPLAFLPIHAAGFYNEQYSERGHKVFDFVISSYVPSLSTLVPSLSAATLPSGDLRLLLVPQPDSDGQAKLPGVAVELQHIKDVVSRSPLACTTLEPSDGTVEEVLDLMREADWVHFACHGVQDGVDSGLYLANKRRLKLRDIVGLSRPRGGLAFLSACDTAKGEQRLSDEAIHTAAGMLSAGYGGVIGTMWAVNDGVAPGVARDVYEELLGKGPRADHREAARALHKATRNMREQGLPFNEWIPFVHVGL